MNHHQIEKNSMYKKMLLFFANPLYSIIWVSFERLANEIANFVSLESKLSGHVQKQHADISGVKSTRDNAFIAMVNLVVSKVQRAYVWAMDTNNDKLAGIFDITKSDFTKAPEITAFAKIKNVRDALNANIASMASVQLTAADVEAIDKAIAAYQNTIGSTGAAKAVKTAGTQGIDDLIQSIDKSLGIIDRLTISSYSESNPDMIKEYWINRNIEKLPTHHSGIYMHITDSITGQDLQGVLMAVNGKSTISDIEGIAEIIKLKPGTYDAVVSYEGYTEQRIRIVISKGKLLELEVKMTK